MTTIRVFIVDDVTEVRRDLCMLLTLAGGVDQESPIEIVGEAADGLDAIRQIEALEPEVVLMDLEMPVMGGYEAARQIKQRCHACRVIALTVHDYEAARERAFQAGIDDFIVKGAPLEVLMQAILERKE